MELRKSPMSYIMFAIATLIYIYLTIKVNSEEPLYFDQVVSSFLTNVFTESSHPFFKLLNDIGSTIGIGITALIAVAILWMKKSDYLGMSVLTITVSTGWLLNLSAKNFVGRPRPETEHLVHVKTLSFPSGHAMMSTILYLLIAYFFIKSIHTHIGKWVVLIITLVSILLMGISRIVLQVHYPSDVVAGFALGLICALIGIIVYELLRKKLKE